ncbi:uncharacterized protein V6R79_014211 [Siganus canaliculatus]
MVYLVHTAHWQFLGLTTGVLSWILILFTTGVNEWRLWEVEDESVITSGLAWVGIWRACFYTQVLPDVETCESISISDDFAPVEIPVAQVLMMLAVISGLAGNLSAGAAVRLAYFTLDDRRNMRLFFVLAGSLYVLTGIMCLVPLVWNMTSVLVGSTIDFPPEFHLPAAPVSQRVGSAIIVGIIGSILMLFSGIVFLSYRHIWHTVRSEDPRDPLNGAGTKTTLGQKSELQKEDSRGRDNKGFQSEEALQI